MTWYEWIWGVTSTLCVLVVVGLAGVAFYVEVWEKRRERWKAKNDELNTYKARVLRLELTVERLRVENIELKKGTNEYGRISP